ncbi:EamA family transporter [Roseomonas elaeocarpi]|uniref:EamA family transporter n=1 Tax=Roseomonas elaeocarpi TaxID=907779 RepID=A0ABV6JY24_9PROT
MSTATLPLRHALLALAVVAVWGINFVVARHGLDQFPPFLFAALRFTFALLPAAFFLRRPHVRWGNMVAYGLLIGTGQFGLLYFAMRGLISPGLASLVMQVQVFFTIGLAMLLTGERVRPYQFAALLLGAAGIAVIAANTGGETTVLGLAITLLAALSWACGNIAVMRSGANDILGYVVWASLFSAPPLYVLSFVLEGWPAMRDSLATAGAAAWGTVAYQSFGNTLFGYAAWGWLLRRYPSATVSPMALLIPVVGMGSAALLLGESLPAWKLGAAGLVIGGLVVSLLWPRWRARQARHA